MITLGASTVENALFHDWGCGRVVVPIVLALLTVIWFVLKRDDFEAKKAVYKIKEQVANMFTNTVVSELRRLVRIVEKHLPEALGQLEVQNARPSRFDHFCAAVRNMTAEEFEQRGDILRAIIKHEFSGILEKEIEELIEVAERGGGSGVSKSGNPSGMQYALEWETVLKLVFLARKTVWAERVYRRYYAARKAALFSFIISASP